MDPVINAELMHPMMLMGHGDELVVCDVNHPAQTIARHTPYGKLIDLSGCGLARAAECEMPQFGTL
ncbi:RbsD/FucU domain-containing protein [Rhizobium leguminosarum]|uniref:RbsD/FucU domain-containing protein n=1 Tax=Rhizobium leguminosarum TaxID=384 RepID=UPI003F9C1B37